MKVSEAKEKVCPFTVQYGGVQSSKDVGGSGLHAGDMLASKCVCGDCMAWKFTKTAYRVPEHDGHPATWVPFDESEKEGYCARIGE